MLDTEQVAEQKLTRSEVVDLVLQEMLDAKQAEIDALVAAVHEEVRPPMPQVWRLLSLFTSAAPSEVDAVYGMVHAGMVQVRLSMTFSEKKVFGPEYLAERAAQAKRHERIDAARAELQRIKGDIRATRNRILAGLLNGDAHGQKLLAMIKRTATALVAAPKPKRLSA